MCLYVHFLRHCRWILLIGMALTNVSGFTQSQKINSYRSFLNARKLYDSASAMLDEHQYRQALPLFEKASLDPDQKRSALNGAAICYMKAGQRQRALNAIGEAFRSGYMLQYMQEDEALNPIWSEMQKLYAEWRPRFLTTLDTVLRSELGEMQNRDQRIRTMLRQVPKEKRDSVMREMVRIDSANISRLKQIEKQVGWPGFARIGNRQTYPSDTEVDPALLVIHASEEDNLFFLQSVLDKIDKGEASWWDAYEIMKNLVFRFDGVAGHTKLRHTFFDENGNLDEEKSFFQLHVLADFLENNPRQKVVLNVVRYENESEANVTRYRKALSSIRNVLAGEGVDPQRITTRNQVVLVNDDNLGRYRIALYRQP
jgi:hypothetical protein